MTFVNRIAGATALGAALLLGLLSPPAQAGYIVTLTQQGNDVVASGSGTIDLISLTPFGSASGAAAIEPINGRVHTGPTAFVATDSYSGFTGPFGFGSGLFTFPSSGSGDMVGIDRADNVIYVPAGYASDGALSDTSTYAGQTFSSLGVTPGSYVWTWGSGAHADSFTLDIVTGTVREPSSLLLLVPLGVLSLLAARHRLATPIA